MSQGTLKTLIGWRKVWKIEHRHEDRKLIKYIHTKMHTPYAASPVWHAFSRRRTHTELIIYQRINNYIMLEQCKKRSCKNKLYLTLKLNLCGISCLCLLDSKPKSLLFPAYLEAMLLRRHPHKPLSCPIGLAGGSEHSVGGRRPRPRPWW